MELEFREVFDRFGIKDKNPKLNTEKDPEELESSIQTDIREDIKNKNRDRSKQMKINVKKFNLYRSLIPSFDFKFTYNHEEFISKRYRFDSPEWKQIFQAESDKVNYKAIKLDIEFPLNKDANVELEQIKDEVPSYKRKAIFTIATKIATISLFIWSMIIFVQNTFFRENLHISTYNITRHISRSILWYLTGLLTIGLLYYVSRIKIYDPSMTNLRQRIIDDPSFVLPQKANVRHFRKQYIQMILFTLFALVLFLSSGFLRILR